MGFWDCFKKTNPEISQLRNQVVLLQSEINIYKDQIKKLTLIKDEREELFNNKYPKNRITYNGEFGLPQDVRNYIFNYSYILEDYCTKNKLFEGTDDEKILKILTCVVRDIKYISDKKNYNYDEFWADGEITLGRGSGDCDDFALLIKSLSLIVGIKDYKVKVCAGWVKDQNNKNAGHCYCFTEDMDVKTNEGYKKIKDIKIGDLVLTHKNRYKRVNHIFERDYKGKINKIIGTGINEIKSTPNHPFLAYKPKTWSIMNRLINKNILKKPNSWYNAEDLNIKDYLVGLRKEPESSQDNYESGYFVGFCIGDGNIQFKEDKKTPKRTRIAFQNNDKNLICFNKIKKYLESININNTSIYYTKERNMFYLNINNKELTKFILDCGCYTKNKFLSENIKSKNSVFLKGIIDGLVDSDGCINKNGSKCILTVYKRLALDICEILNNLNIPYSIYKNSQRTTFTPFFPTISYNIKIPIETSNNCRIKYFDDFWLSPITKNEQEDFEGKVYNLEVEEDNSYTINGIIVHNCIYLRDDNTWCIIDGTYYVDFTPVKNRIEHKKDKRYYPVTDPIWFTFNREFSWAQTEVEI